MSIQRKIAVVSGGAGGIGQAVVLRLAQDDYLPIVLDRDSRSGDVALKRLKERGKEGRFVEVELTSRQAVQEAFQRMATEYGSLSLLVNLAGGTIHKRVIQDFDLPAWREVIDCNLKATFLCCQAAIRLMKEHGGVIINTSSNFGITGSIGRTAYSAAKAAVIAFTKSLASEMAPYGIRANVVAPGLTATSRVMNSNSPEEWLQLSSKIPVGRAGEPQDIAEGVAFLASEEASFITGQTFHINGGLIFS